MCKVAVIELNMCQQLTGAEIYVLLSMVIFDERVKLSIIFGRS